MGNNDLLKYGAGMALGLAGFTGCILGLTKVSSDTKRRNQEYSKYVMEHPAEYEEYKNVDRFRELEEENTRLNSSVRNMQNDLAAYRRNYDDSMRRLKSYVDKDMENLEKTKQNLKAYFGEENT